MTANELLVDSACDPFQVLRTSLLEQQREKVDLEEQVTELVRELRVVAGDGSVRDFVRFLDRVWDDRAFRLFSIPGTVAAESLGQLLEVDERLGETHLL